MAEAFEASDSFVLSLSLSLSVCVCVNIYVYMLCDLNAAFLVCILCAPSPPPQKKPHTNRDCWKE